MQYRVLGPVELADDGLGRPLGSPNQERLLAVLLAARGGTVAVDTLVDALWGDEPPSTAIPTLRTYVSRLRRSVGASLESDRGGYRLALQPGDLDADRFDELRRVGDDVDPRAGLAALDAALGLWRGEPFAGHTHLAPVLAEARRLLELRAAAEIRRLELLVECGELDRAVADAEARVTVDPHDEPAWVVLVDALVRRGRPLDATRAAHRARAGLAEVGLTPGPDLLAAEARAVDPAPDVPRRARPRGRTTPRPSSILGRQTDVATVLELLAGARVVTLVGPGGVGKTRLAHEVVARVEASDSWLVELGHLDAGADVAAALVSGLGLVGREPDVDRAVARVGDLDGLLVLDNAEHVIDEVATTVWRMMAGGPSLRVLVTSRERLGIDGEHVHRVLPLERRDPEDPAQRLLVERARAAGVSIDLARDADGVDRIVELLDGLPLAIEMAAAHLTTCTIRELGDRLEAGETGLSTGLSTGRRDVDARHRTLADVIGWSLDGLADGDAEVLRDLTVFAGSFTLDDVAAVVGRNAAPVVRRLAERSLLTISHGAERVRFSHFHVVREHLAVACEPVPGSLRAVHARWCLDTVRRADARLRTRDEPAAREVITGMLAEVRSAHQWATTNDRPVALALSAGLHRYAQGALHDEVLGWADRLVGDGTDPADDRRDDDRRDDDRGDDDRRDVAIALASAASRAVNRGDSARGTELARAALAVAPDDEAALPALEILADAAMYGGRLDAARRSYAELYERGRRVGDDWYWPMGWSGLVLVAAYGGPPADDVRADLDVDGLDALPPTARAFVEYARAELIVEDDPGAALEHLSHLLEIVRAVPSPYSEGITLTSIAAVSGRVGDPAQALVDHRAAIGHWLGLADRSHQATALRNLVPVLARVGAHEVAAELLGLLDACGIPTYGAEAGRLDGAREQIRGALGPTRADALAGRGSRRDLLDGARWVIDELDRLTVDTD